MKSIMITGCAGFIGSHAVDLFLQKGYKVIGVDCFTYAGKPENIKHNLGNTNFKIYNYNICSTSRIEQICKDEDVEWIINFAAESHVDNSIDSCDNFITTNVFGVKSLLEVCKDNDIGLFHISTDEVYGDILEGSFCEEDKLNPKNPYSATKAAAEHMVQSYSNTYGVKYLMVRPSNNFGPRQHAEKFLPTIIRNLKEGTKIPLYGTGENVRDWLYVKDCVKIIYNIFDSKVNEGVFNIGSERVISNKVLVKQLIKNYLKIMQKDNSKLNKKKYFKFVDDRPGHDFMYRLDLSKIKKTGFLHKSDFSLNLYETVNYYVHEK